MSGDRWQDYHWMKFDDDRMILGCQCGFAADESDCGFGDGTLDHIVEAAREFVSTPDEPRRMCTQ